MGHGVLMFALLATTAVTFDGGTTTLFFMPRGGEKVRVGDTVEIDVNVNTRTAINALGATVAFPREHLEIVAISKEASFLDLWTEETAIKESAGEIHFSGGTFREGGLSGTGTMLTLTVRALRPGEARLAFKDAEVYSHDGRGLVVDKRLHAVELIVAPREPHQPPGTSETVVTKKTEGPTSDFNGDGRVTLVDASILTFHLFRPYEPRFDLDVDGRVGLSDISILFSRMSH
jgi:hypothetical protein